MEEIEEHLRAALEKGGLPSQADSNPAPLLECPGWLHTQAIVDARTEVEATKKAKKTKKEKEKKAKKAKKGKEDSEKAEEDTPANDDDHPAPTPSPKLDVVWNYNWISLQPTLTLDAFQDIAGLVEDLGLAPQVQGLQPGPRFRFPE